MNRTTKRIGALGTATVAVMGTGIAFAAWTASGAGQGSAASVANQDVTFAPAAASVTNKLYPGGTGDAAISVTNPNPYTVSLSTFVLNHAYTESNWAAHQADNNVALVEQKSTCDLSITQPSTAPTVTNGTHTVVLTNNVSMGNGSVNSCANQTFVLDISASTSS